MITVENLSFSYPKKDLYNDVSFSINKGEHCVLIGTVGSGKTTLIEIISGRHHQLYDGKVTLEDNLLIGYTSQFYKHEKAETSVFDYIASDYIAMQKNIDDLCDKMGTAEDLDSVMEEYQVALDKFETMGGHTYEAEILKQLNLTDLLKNRDLPIANLSGGEFKLVQLIKEMIKNHDLLIMDEPDVFLDFDNLTALKNLINYHKGTLLVITHNRYLLSQCFNKIIHLENTKIQEFYGKYTEYNLYLLEKKIDLQELALADTLELERNEKLIDDLRDIATENPDQVHGKTLKARVKFHERLEARRIKEPFIYVNTPDFTFTNSNENSEGEAVISVDNLTVTFEDILLQNVSFDINFGEKVAIIGANGTGKTTILRQILKGNNPSVTIKENAKIQYVSQALNETLNDTNTIYDEFFDVGLKTYDDIEKYLENYGFTQDKLTSRISTLSGGEKNTIQMAKIAFNSADVLVLDEPSSHLDIYSQIALEKAVKDYNGTVLMVSHDFYFIANCMDYLLLIDDKTVRKMSNRKFRKNMYAKHFDKDYLLAQEKYSLLVNNLENAIVNNEFDAARNLLEQCKALLPQLI